MTAPEERIGAAVAAWFRDLSHDVYAEVVLPGSERRADIVAVTRVPDPCIAICECKAAFGLDVLRQALAWEGWAHTLYVATGPVSSRNMQTARDVADGLGLSWLCVIGDDVRMQSHPTLRQCRRTRVVTDALRPEHRDAAPGNARGNYHTAWAENAAHLRRIGAAEPGCALTDALRIVLGKTPDAATRRAWAKAVRMGQVPGVRSEGKGRGVVLLPDDVTAKGVF